MSNMGVVLNVLWLGVIGLLSIVNARIPGTYQGGPWTTAHATFYGGDDASGTMGMYSTTSYTHLIIIVLFLIPLILLVFINL